MSFEEMINLFEKQRENRKKQKGKLITIPVEQLDQIEEEYIKIQKQLKINKEELEKTKEKLAGETSKSKSWMNKYIWQISKSKKEIKKELKEELEPQVRKEIEWKLSNKLRELESEYHQKKINLKSEYYQKEMRLEENINNKIESVVKERIEKLEKVRDNFSERLSKEKDRYEEKYDLDSERNQGYLIGIAKTKKEMIKAFDEILETK